MTKSFTLADIAQALDGTLSGDGALTVTRPAHPAAVTGPNDLALAMDAKLVPLLKDTLALAAITSMGEDGARAVGTEHLKAVIAVKRPRLAMAKLTVMFEQPVILAAGIHKSAVIEDGATLDQDVRVGALVYVGANAKIGGGTAIHPQCYIGPDAVIGRNCVIYAGVRIGAHVVIGDNCIIHFNASIGADGFSFVTPQLGSVEAAKAGGGETVTASNAELVRIASLGAVEIGDNVEIGANSAIDRGTIASTRIGSGTKIDNQVQIGHNVVVGQNCLICGGVGIAGSCKIGDRVVLGGASGVADHVTVGDDVIVMAMSGVASNVPPRMIMGGLPAIPRDRLMKQVLAIGRLETYSRKIEAIGARLDALEDQVKKV